MSAGGLRLICRMAAPVLGGTVRGAGGGLRPAVELSCRVAADRRCRRRRAAEPLLVPPGDLRPRRDLLAWCQHGSGGGRRRIWPARCTLGSHGGRCCARPRPAAADGGGGLQNSTARPLRRLRRLTERPRRLPEPRPGWLQRSRRLRESLSSLSGLTALPRHRGGAAVGGSWEARLGDKSGGSRGREPPPARWAVAAGGRAPGPRRRRSAASRRGCSRPRGGWRGAASAAVRHCTCGAGGRSGCIGGQRRVPAVR